METDVARRLQVFTRAEKAREHLEKVAQEHADEWAEKRRAYVFIPVSHFFTLSYCLSGREYLKMPDRLNKKDSSMFFY